MGVCWGVCSVFSLLLKTLVGRNLGILTIQAHSLGLIHFFNRIAPSVSGRTFEILSK